MSEEIILPEKIIHVPALVEDEETIIPEFWLGELKRFHYCKSDPYNGKTAGIGHGSGRQYDKALKLPTIAQLRRAFFDKNENGEFVAPAYRQRLPKYAREWTSTYLIRYENNYILIENPEEFSYSETLRLLIPEGGKRTIIDIPSPGWALEYDKNTGLATKTSKNEDDAREIFGEDASSFDISLPSMSTVQFRRSFPFGIGFDDPTCDEHDNDGGRQCSRDGKYVLYLDNDRFVDFKD